VVCLGDSFDDATAADALDEVTAAHLTPLMAGRAWIWIEGNHDPGPLGLGGTHRAALRVSCVVFRHIADPAATGEISGHYHPKARLRTRAGSDHAALFPPGRPAHDPARLRHLYRAVSSAMRRSLTE
jgi:metallophosphoesterase superfamily enzyme